MTTRTASRRLVDPNYATARSVIAFPLPLDVDLAPQLIAVTLAQASLAATHRAIDSAHPVLALAKVPGNCPTLRLRRRRRPGQHRPRRRHTLLTFLA